MTAEPAGQFRPRSVALPPGKADGLSSSSDPAPKSLLIGTGTGDPDGVAVGDTDGVGVAVAEVVGDAVGDVVGLGVGDWVGVGVGLGVGFGVGDFVGDGVGDAVGLAVQVCRMVCVLPVCPLASVAEAVIVSIESFGGAVLLVQVTEA